MRGVWILALSAAVLAGCARTYVTDDGRPFSQTEYERDLADCKTELYKVPLDARIPGITARRFRDRCMRARGWVPE